MGDDWKTKAASSRPVIDATNPLPRFLPLPGGGSDFTSFLDREGVPSLDITFSDLHIWPHDAKYGQYHSVYDDFHWMEKFVDPSFTLHCKNTSFLLAAAVTMAVMPLLPMDSTANADIIHHFTSRPLVDALEKAAEKDQRFGQINTEAMMTAAKKYRSVSVLLKAQQLDLFFPSGSSSSSSSEADDDDDDELGTITADDDDDEDDDDDDDVSNITTMSGKSSAIAARYSRQGSPPLGWPRRGGNSWMVAKMEHSGDGPAAMTAMHYPEQTPHDVLSSAGEISFDGGGRLGDERRRGALLSAASLRIIDDINSRLMLSERLFVVQGGIPGRKYFKNVLVAPGVDNGYAAQIFPGIVEAIVNGNPELCQEQITLAAERVDMAADCLTNTGYCFDIVGESERSLATSWQRQQRSAPFSGTSLRGSSSNNSNSGEEDERRRQDGRFWRKAAAAAASGPHKEED